MISVPGVSLPKQIADTDIDLKTKTVRVVIDDFDNFEGVEGQHVNRYFYVHGYHFVIEVIFDRGTGVVSCCLNLLDYAVMTVSVVFRQMTQQGPYERSKKCTIYDSPDPNYEFKGCEVYPFRPRQDAVDACIDGSFVLECDIKISEAARFTWYPPKLEPLPLVPDQQGPDVVFSVDDKLFPAHKQVLSLRCQVLSDIVSGFDHDGDITRIPISDVSATVFKALLDCVYGKWTLPCFSTYHGIIEDITPPYASTPPFISTEEATIKYLVAGDRYGCEYLKLYAESVLVDVFLDTTNAVELLQDAERYSCPLLKEAAINLLFEDDQVLEKAERLPVELQREVYNALHRDESVTTLRQQLQEAHLSVDGSREDLVYRWSTRNYGN